MSDDPLTAAPAQAWDARGYARNARFVADFGVAVVDLLAPRHGERILDLGCGDGALSAELAARGATVVGVDTSAELVAAARTAGVDARLMSGAALAFAGEFDAVFSNAALHWMLDPDAVLRGVRRSLLPAGRFVGEFGGHGNVAAISTALRAVLRTHARDVASPWYFPTADDYAAKLSSHGFSVQSCVIYARPTPLPTGMRGWLDTFANPFLAAVDPPARRSILDDVCELLAPSLRDQAGYWTADYVRLRFAATRA